MSDSTTVETAAAPEPATSAGGEVRAAPFPT